MLLPHEFLHYLEQNDAFYGSPNVVILKSRKISNTYIDQRIFSKDAAKHEPMLFSLGRVITEVAKNLGADTVVGIVTTGAVFATYANHATDIPYETIDPHKDHALSGDIFGKYVLVVDDTCTTGTSIAESIAACREAGAIVVGAFVTVRRDPNVTHEHLDLECDDQFVVFCDLDFEVITESTVGEDLANSTLMQGLLAGELQMRLDIAYAATDGWHENPDLKGIKFVGEPVIKS